MPLNNLDTSNFLNSSFWLVILIFFLILVLIIIFSKKTLARKKQYKSAFEKVLLLITLPQEEIKKEETKKTAKAWISLMESFLANVGGLKAERGLKASLSGRSDHFSFEIVADKEGDIAFYVAVPFHLEQFFRQQIQAQYPEANIERVKDYNIFVPQGAVAGAYLKLQRPWILPIRTYLSQEDIDPLNAITNALYQVDKEDGVAIQIVARSAKSSWHKKGPRVAQDMQQGKKFQDALSEMEASQLSKFLKSFWSAVKTKKQETEEEKLKKPYQLSPMEQELAQSLEKKASKAGFDINIRLVASARTKEKADFYLNNVLNSFLGYSGYEYGNGFKAVKTGNSSKLIYDFIYRHFDPSHSFILNTEELASIYHFPTPTLETPNIRWLQFRKAPAPVNIPSQGIILGENVYRGTKKIIRIKRDDRRRHVYIIGRTGAGKSYLMTNMAIQDIQNGEGVCLLDPHGDLIEDVLGHVPKERIKDVIVFDPSDIARPMGFNLLEYDPNFPEQKTFVINEMIKILDKLYDLRQTGGPMFEQYLRNAMLLIMEDPASGATLMEISEVLANPDFRHYKIEHSKNKVVNDFWLQQAEKAGGETALSNMTPYITSKLNQFVANDLMRPIIAQQKSAFNIRQLMDEQKIFLINLCKGKTGDLNAYLLGLIIVGKILMAALSRVDQPVEERKDFYLYIDEFQNFITDSISTILAEARKYKLNLTIAHQYIGQLIKGQDTSIRDAVLGTVGTYISFKVGVEDAEILAKEYEPVFSPYDLVNIERYNCYVKLLVDNQSIRPFNMRVLARDKGNPEIAKAIKEYSRLTYGQPREVIEQEIASRSFPQS